MRLLPTVSLRGITPQLALAISIAADVWHAAGHTLTITSITDGTSHSRTSLHWAGCAFDCRTRDLPGGEAEPMGAKLKAALGSEDFDVIVERTHIHVEWQPKGPPS